MDTQPTVETNTFSERAWTGLASVECARGSIYKTHPNLHTYVHYRHIQDEFEDLISADDFDKMSQDEDFQAFAWYT